MRLTKFGHSCVRVEHDGGVVVIDPGTFTETAALDGVTAVLITHEHPDHYVADQLRPTDAAVCTRPTSLRTSTTTPPTSPRGSPSCRRASRSTSACRCACGGLHTVIHPDFPRFHNSGYVVTAGETSVYHPGDALTAPGQDVDVLCLPVSAPWMRASEAVDFAREVRAPRNVAIHDRVYSEAGLSIVDGHLNAFLPKEGLSYVRLPDGADL